MILHPRKVRTILRNLCKPATKPGTKPGYKPGNKQGKKSGNKPGKKGKLTTSDDLKELLQAAPEALQPYLVSWVQGHGTLYLLAADQYPLGCCAGRPYQRRGPLSTR